MLIQPLKIEEMDVDNLNTSHVNVNLFNFTCLYFSPYNLNTSHVNVNRVISIIMPPWQEI